MRVYKNCRDCPGEYKALTSEARNLTNILTDISDKLDMIPNNKKPQLQDAYDTCVDVLQELDKILLHYNSLDTRSKRAWDRLKWDSEKSRTLREKLTSSVVLLSNFYTSLVVDSQVLILEALNRLELDYRGGHREESIASIEKIASGSSQEEVEEEDEAAWTQIIRDLEDAGISQQDAVDYRDFIVDWFVRAVNQGRLLEQPSSERQIESLSPFDDLNESFNNALAGTVPSQESALLGPSSSETPNLGFTSVSSDTRSGSLTYEDSTSELPVPGISRPPTYTETPIPLSNESRPAAETNHLFVDPQLPARSTTVSSLPAYDQIDTWADSDLESKAQQIVNAWDRRDFVMAGKHLEDQLVAVERGETSVVNNNRVQPDRRVLRHLMGVCASYSGDFVKAKALFESVFNGMYLSGSNVDDGDIAAARWIGDCCLHLDESPENTTLAWAVALVGLTARYGSSNSVARRVASELKSLDSRLQGLQLLEQSLRRNHDCSTIFRGAHATEKMTLIMSVKTLKGVMAVPPADQSQPASVDLTTAALKSLRPHTDWRVAKGFLVQPLVSQSAWPLQWDTTFDPVDAINLRWQMHSSAFMGGGAFQYSNIPSISLVSAKDFLNFVTKRDIRWLADTVRNGLAEMGIQFKEQSSTMMCRVSQKRDGFVFHEGIAIKFKKVQFRSMHGVRVTDVQFSTRGIPSTGFLLLDRQKSADEFREVLRGILQTAENEAKIKEMQSKRS